LLIESGCKGKDYFSNFQIIFEKILKNFLKNLFATSQECSPLDCGCKGTQKFVTSKHFRVFFQKFYN
ncbi:MAG: hypothetical protein J6L75_00360, partial [Alistipes sp.]|nr:hypothetical protein [Alistipes sp.]